MEDLNSEKDSEKDAVLCEIFTSLKALANLRKQYDNATSEVCTLFLYNQYVILLCRVTLIYQRQDIVWA